MSLLDLLQTSRGLLTVSANLLAVAAMIPFLYMEVRGTQCLY